MTTPFPLSRATFLALTAGVVLFAASRASAQVQETRMDEILHADRSRTSEYAGKTFASSATVGGKTAATRSFAFNRSAVLRAGDGSFRAKTYTNTDQFRTQDFTTRADRAATSDAFAQSGRGFATKAMPVGEASAANKSAGLGRPYVPAQREMVFRGKRQDDIDSIHDRKDLSIDQVREILNKGPGGPAGKTRDEAAVNASDVRRALPVTTPAFR